MQNRYYSPSGAPILLFAALCLSNSAAQVDADWLKSYNEAQQQRPSELLASSRIAAEDEPGIPLIVRGKVVSPRGEVASGVVVHAYHRDHAGYEFGHKDAELSTWALQGWAKTDAQGRFEFHTIKPAMDHRGREPAHIHFTLESVKYGKQWAPKFHFAEDSLDEHESTGVPAAGNAIRESPSVASKTDGVKGIFTIDVTLRLKEQADFN